MNEQLMLSSNCTLSFAASAVVNGKFRYTLSRRWAGGRGLGAINFVMLNPSIADAVRDDPTIRRCISFGMRMGYDELVVTNLFAFVSTDPMKIPGCPDPVGPANDVYIRSCAETSAVVVAAWGAVGGRTARATAVLSTITPPGGWMCLGVTKEGYPRHPLYVRGDADLVNLELPK